MAALIIQLGGKHSKVTDVFRSTDEQINVGRAYNNQLILSDPYIAPQQAQFYYTDVGWRLRINDNANRILHNGKVVEQDDLAIQPGDSLTLGRTELRIYSEDFAVEETRQLLVSRWLHSSSVGVLAPLMALAAMLLIGLCSFYLEDSSEFEWKYYSYFAMAVAGFALLWAGGWALASRLLRHQHHFGQHLLVTASALGIVEVSNILPSYLGFMLSSPATEYYLLLLIGFVLFAFMLRYHLFFASHIQRPLRAGLITSAVLMLSVMGLYNMTNEMGVSDKKYSDRLQPGFMYPVGSTDVDGFMLDWAEMMQELDEMAQETRLKELNENN